mmetsp:Transcript_87991/g.193000  ORF Transcript_87991/g.193000 Transcript_87991/m.193000 type:complete len:287 (+) Transcript_87991:1374-2234(+)
MFLVFGPLFLFDVLVPALGSAELLPQLPNLGFLLFALVLLVGLVVVEVSQVTDAVAIAADPSTDAASRLAANVVVLFVDARKLKFRSIASGFATTTTIGFPANTRAPCTARTSSPPAEVGQNLGRFHASFELSQLFVLFLMDVDQLEAEALVLLAEALRPGLLYLEFFDELFGVILDIRQDLAKVFAELHLRSSQLRAQLLLLCLCLPASHGLTSADHITLGGDSDLLFLRLFDLFRGGLKLLKQLRLLAFGFLANLVFASDRLLPQVLDLLLVTFHFRVKQGLHA